MFVKSLRTLNPYFWKHRRLLAWGLIFIILSNFFIIYQVQFVGKTVDIIQGVLQNKDIQKEELLWSLFFNGGWIVSGSFLAGFFRFMMRQTIIVASRRIEYELKNQIYQQYQQLSLSQMRQTSIGDLMNRISEDIVAVRMYLGPGVMYVVNLFILLVITSIYMLMTDWKMTLVTLLPLPVLSFLIYKVSSTINRKSKLLQQSQSAISAFVQDSFTGIRVVHFFNKEKYIFNKYRSRVKTYQQRAMDLARVESIFFTTILFVIGLVNVIILWMGGEKFITGEITVGTIADFFMYANILIWPFSLVGWVSSVNQRAAASMQRILEFMEIKSEIVNTNFEDYEIEGRIEFRNVSYTYPNTGIQAVHNLSFILEPGSMTVMTGKIGSGKSTVALLLCRLIDPSSGQILIDGKDLREHNLEVVRKHLGWVPQESYLFSDTVYNNIAFSVDDTNLEKVVEVAKLAEVHSNIVEFKDEYETVVGERGVMLSGGQKQRICIARALIKNPRMLIFDDSLSALDAETEHRVLENIQKHIPGCTILMITHRTVPESPSVQHIRL